MLKILFDVDTFKVKYLSFCVLIVRLYKIDINKEQDSFVINNLELFCQMEFGRRWRVGEQKNSDDGVSFDVIIANVIKKVERSEGEGGKEKNWSSVKTVNTKFKLPFLQQLLPSFFFFLQQILLFFCS